MEFRTGRLNIMSYDYPRIHKAEENIEHIVTEWVEEHVMEYFSVEEIESITPDQMEEIIAFREELNEYSPMQVGYSNLINYWESFQEYDD